MRKFLTAHHVANDVRLSRTIHKGAILIVEGDTDYKLYSRFVNENKCIIIPAHSKDNALSALDILEKSSFNGIIVIIDADFWRLEGYVANSTNLVMTDSHDLECMIFLSSALDKLLIEYGSEREIRRLGISVRHLVLDNACVVGYLRWLSSPSMEDLSLNFNNLAFTDFIDSSSLKVNIDILLALVKSNSPHSSCNTGNVRQKLIALLSQDHEKSQVCCGHDVVKFLLIGLRNIFGNNNAKDLLESIVDKTLRIGYDYSDFSSSQVFLSITKWQEANSPYEVLISNKE